MNSIQTKGNVILVGERHYDARSKGLIQSVLGSIDDLGAVALEKDRPSLHWRSETGMDHAEEYAFQSETPRYYIDKSGDWLHKQIKSEADMNEVISDGNKFSIEPMPNGDVDIQAICDARRRIHENHGRTVFDALFTDREICMAKNLNQITNDVDGCIIAVVGVFHIFALLDFMDIVETGSEDDVVGECANENRIEGLVSFS